jgi:hypothetical protein
MTPQDNLKDLFNLSKGYVDTKLGLGKYKVVKTSTAISSELISTVAILLIAFLVAGFLGIGGALLIGKYLHSYYTGFTIVSGFYLIIFIVIYKMRMKWIKKPVADDLIQKMSN